MNKKGLLLCVLSWWRGRGATFTCQINRGHEQAQEQARAGKSKQEPRQGWKEEHNSSGCLARGMGLQSVRLSGTTLCSSTDGVTAAQQHPTTRNTL